MKKTTLQVSHAVAPALDDFFTLMLTSAGERACTVKGRQCSPADTSPTLNVVKVSLEEERVSIVQPVCRSRVVLRAFLTMILTIRQRTLHTDHERPQRSALPMGAVLGVRYVS